MLGKVLKFSEGQWGIINACWVILALGSFVFVLEQMAHIPVLKVLRFLCLFVLLQRILLPVYLFDLVWYQVVCDLLSEFSFFLLDFGSWANLDELNLGTNQLAVLPGNGK